ncbi:hypothetical protein L484_026019 [Morus notabilis]|uniref:Late embryogenesis abundant protein LEA-2 subgroup domain-containing protein n=2 Tax=Morus notabilis TaxID=981085 RepID=W9R7T6_9ROSA|nr:hypothetical protein L484_026019 [Morus notabilis]
MKSSRKGLEICCGITATFLIVVALVFTTLWFTTFKPKEPEITAYPVGLEDINVFSIFFVRNITLNMTITINNHRNVGSFEFKNATAYVNYRGGVVAEVPIGQNLVPARGKLNTTTSADLMVGKIITNPVFFDDVAAGSLNLTATAALHGKVRLFEFVKIRATALSTCDISFSIASRNVQSTCKSKIKL